MKRQFVQEYLKDLNAKRAAERAGYSKKTCEQQGSRLLRTVAVATAVAAALEKRAQKAGVTQDQVLNELRKIAFSDMGDFASWGPHGVSMKDSEELEQEARRAVSEVSETETEHGGSRKFKLHDKVAALQLLGRHLGMFTDRLQVSGGFSLSDVREVLKDAGE